MDRSTRQIEVDSASTAHEVVQQIANNVGIIESYGFGIFVKLFDKVGVPCGFNGFILPSQKNIAL